jgi:hypothetical protein
MLASDLFYSIDQTLFAIQQPLYFSFSLAYHEGNADKGGRGDDNGEYGNPSGDGEGHHSDYSSSE